jgi:Protein of unknown function (DUF2971)
VASIEYIQPPKVYRYRSLRKFEQEVEAIEQGYLFCARYTALNDPMEGVFRSSKVFRGSENYRETRKAIIENKTQIGMCSFSEVHDHELMWAHYADQYKGICIAYSLSKLLDALGNNVSFVRMYYNEMVPIVRHSHEEPNDLAKMVLSYKNYRWLYEREWRMFAPPGVASYNNTACVTRVYLGSRISSNRRKRIIKAMTPMAIETHDMSIDKYSIRFEPCS